MRANGRSLVDSPDGKSGEQRFFWYAVLLASLIHVGGAMALVWGGPEMTVPLYVPLASMDFSPYDAQGGESGGGAGTFAEAPEREQTPPEPEQRPEPEPEPEAREEVPVVESTAEKAEPVAPPPPSREKPKPRPKAKPRPGPVVSDAPVEDSQGAGAASGDAGLGSGKGEGKGEGEGKGKAGSGGGTGRGNPDAEKAYLAHIIKKLNRHKKYPAEAKANRLGGVVTVSFTVDRQGRVSASRMSGSSGHSALDQEAMALLKRVSPFNPMPESMSQKSLRLNVPIRFSLH